MEGSTANAVSILSDSLSTVQSDMMSAIGSAVPIALGIAATVLVITLGWKLFKRLTK